MGSTEQQSDPLSPQNDVYTVIVRRERFELYHDQITFDSPNYFTACFLSDFSESAARTLRLSRNPTLFSIIVEYLSGYPILPLSAQTIPSTMDLASAHRCLLADAQFYGLQRLCELLESRRPEIDLRWTGYANEMVSLRDVVKGTLPAGIVQRDDGTLVSLDSGLPPLVFVKDVVFTLLLNTTAKAEMSERALWSRRYSRAERHLGLSIRITSPSTPTTPSKDVVLSLDPFSEASPSALMSDRTSGSYGSFCKTVKREEYWDRHVYVDGKLRDFGRICALEDDLGLDEGVRVRLMNTFSEGERMLRWREVSLVWWADEVLFRLIPRGHTVGPSAPEDALAVDLVYARLRTRRNVLQNVRVLATGAEGDD
ncbi:hypothetical protein V8D89_012191 [Ganoderma adspersum]